ncbi:MAG: hypothetical protein AAFV53_14950, partial [Myxococcota bacterium]
MIRMVPSPPMGVWLIVWLSLTVTPFAGTLIARDGDALTHARIGRALLDGGWPTHDPILTPPVPVQLHEWGFEVLLAVSGEALGLGGYALIAALFIATALAITLARMLQDGRIWPVLFLSGLGFPFVLLHLHARPHVASWLGVALCTAALEQWRRKQLSDGRLWMAAGALGLAWANLHGGFVIGGLIGLAYSLDALIKAPRRLIPLAGAGGSFGLASLVNPDGIGLHQHVLSFLRDTEAQAPIADMIPLDPTSASGILPMAWIAVVGGLVVLRRRDVTIAEGALVVLWSVATIRLVRNAPLMMLGTAPLAARLASTALAAGVRRGQPIAMELEASCQRLEALFQRTDGRLSVSVALVGVMGLLGTGTVSPSLPHETVPVDALSWLNDHPEITAQRGLTVFHWGGIVAHEVEGSRVFIHPLNAVYPIERQQAYGLIHNMLP